jgi:hypothetical protein
MHGGQNFQQMICSKDRNHRLNLAFGRIEHEHTKQRMNIQSCKDSGLIPHVVYPTARGIAAAAAAAATLGPQAGETIDAHHGTYDNTHGGRHIC